VSRENVELVRTALEAANAGGVEAALSFFSSDAVWYATDRWLESGAYRGHDDLRRLYASFGDSFDDHAWEIEDIRDAGHRVVALVHHTGRIKNSGQLMSQPLGLVISDFRGAAFGEVRTFATWHEALQAAGLEE
jgi:ketosteroid isomerase-like protein